MRPPRETPGHLFKADVKTERYFHLDFFLKVLSQSTLRLIATSRGSSLSVLSLSKDELNPNLRICEFKYKLIFPTTTRPSLSKEGITTTELV